MSQRSKSLTKKERAAQRVFLSALRIPKRRTKRPFIVGMIGLVGAGKSSVARELAKHIGAAIIEGDAIRIELRRQQERYEGARAIAENAAAEVLKRGGNAVIDSDFIDAQKRAALRRKARKVGARVAFICVYCDPDVMIARDISAAYRNRVGDFFGGANAVGVKGSLKGAVVKLREMWRRTPHHYRWVNSGGGRWEIKKPPVPVLADIDTTDSRSWKREAARAAKKLLR